MDINKFLRDFMVKKALVKEGYVNPTYPVGHPQYGQPVLGYQGEPASLSPQRALTLELRRNMEYDRRDGAQMYPGYDQGVDAMVAREKFGPYYYEMR